MICFVLTSIFVRFGLCRLDKKLFVCQSTKTEMNNALKLPTSSSAKFSSVEVQQNASTKLLTLEIQKQVVILTSPMAGPAGSQDDDGCATRTTRCDDLR